MTAHTDFTVRDTDAAQEMLDMLRAFEERPSMTGDAYTEDREHDGIEPADRAEDNWAAMKHHLQRSANHTVNALWNEEWVYPVEAWSLILGLDIPFWEEGWRECAASERANDRPQCALLLNELERLRGLRILTANDDGKIRRNDAVRVAHALGYAIEAGSPAFDILVHRWGIPPSHIRTKPIRLDVEFHGAKGCSWPIIQAVAAVLTFFPDVAATAWRDDAAQAILQTIRERQILPPAFFDDIESDRELIETIAKTLALVRDSFSESCEHPPNSIE